ncbi:MAG: polyhydroxyalkanoate synthesis repressor PhaR, partial [Thiotrichales bacterium]
MSGERLIKKYPNRRLYDTVQSKYITLSEVRDLVMRGVSFKVLDSQTETDLTRTILLQIIMDQEAGGQPLFTADMLSRFIRVYGDATQSMFSAFLDQGMQFFAEQQRRVSERTSGLWSMNPVDFWMKVGQQNVGL